MSCMVAIVGRPNVGKSTLFNRIVGYNKAIVDDMPGVTIDRNYAQVKLDHRSFTLVDTGGFDAEETDKIMVQVREQTIMALEEADLTVLLVDGKQGLNPNDRELLDLLRRSGKPFLVGVNKIDGPEKEDALSDFFELGIDDAIPLSAAHGYGVKDFLRIISETLPPFEEYEPPEGVVRVAVVGRPNVGKSSLINCLTGDQRAVVTDVPGTTRDPLDIDIEHEGKHYVFVDTAGIRRKGKTSYKLEKFSVIRALKSLERADIALLLIDSTEGVTDQDAHVAGYAVERGRGLIMLFNKWDLVKDKASAQKKIKDYLDIKLSFLKYAPYLTGSAKTGMRMQKIYGMVDDVYKQYSARFPTGQVNRVLERAVEAHTPPYVGRNRLKFYYASQVSTRPPTFVAFANRPDKVHFSYHRYLTNSFRDAFGLDKIPVRVIIRSKHKDKR